MHKTKLFLALAIQLHLSVDIDPSFAVIEVLIKEKKKKKKTIDKEVVVDSLMPIYNVTVKRFIKKILKMYLFSFKACQLHYASICLSLY